MFIPKLTQTRSAFLSWTKDLTIGHELIDADHQRIFHIANRLQSEILDRPGPDFSIVGEVLAKLIEHTGSHFAREEALMQGIRFPGYDEHKRQHEMLMNKVNDLQRQFMNGRADLSDEIFEFLQHSVVPHILKSDMELGRSLRAVK